MIQLFPILLFGFFLGVKHAFDADHLVAVSAMVSTHKNPFKAALVGAFWGMGHTTTLFLVGLLVLMLKVSIPQSLSLSFEILVGVMLVVLGISKLKGTSKKTHIHRHQHGSFLHSHTHPSGLIGHFHQHKRSFLIGIIHGLAGSGALMILVLSAIRSTVDGIFYILIFGIGSILGMSIISVILGLPFILSKKKFPKTEKYLTFITGILGIIIGISLIYEIGMK